MITISKKQIKDFVNKQPDDKPIDFQQNFSKDSCGCLMVHIGKELGFKDFKCGIYYIANDKDETVLNIESNIVENILKLKNLPNNYKELKNLLDKVI